MNGSPIDTFNFNKVERFTYPLLCTWIGSMIIGLMVYISYLFILKIYYLRKFDKVDIIMDIARPTAWSILIIITLVFIIIWILKMIYYCHDLCKPKNVKEKEKCK